MQVLETQRFGAASRAVRSFRRTLRTSKRRAVWPAFSICAQGNLVVLPADAERRDDQGDAGKGGEGGQSEEGADHGYCLQVRCGGFHRWIAVGLGGRTVSIGCRNRVTPVTNVPKDTTTYV